MPIKREDKKPVRFRIPMKSYLVKFLTSKFGSKHHANKRTHLGIYFCSTMLTKDHRKRVKRKEGAYFVFEIPFSLCQANGFRLRTENIGQFQSYVEKLFFDFMYHHVLINTTPSAYNEGAEVTKSIDHFLLVHDINEDDLKAESAYRLYYRYLEKTQRNLSSKKMLKKIVS